MTDAGKCRSSGWKVGDVLEGDEGYGPTRIVLTAIGEEKVLARELCHNGIDSNRSEGCWTLQARRWRRVARLIKIRGRWV